MRIDKRRAIVRARTLMAIEHAQSTEETRYYLRGAHIEPTEVGPVVVATDGHLMAVIREPEGYVEGLATIWNHSISARFARQIVRFEKEHSILMKRTKNPMHLWCDLDITDVTTGQIRLHLAEKATDCLDQASNPLASEKVKGLMVDGTFPEWRRVWPTPTRQADKPPPHLNEAIRERLVKVAKQILKRDDKTKILSMQLHDFGPTSPARITVDGIPDLAMIIMPIRGVEDGIAAQAGWLDQLLPEHARQPVPKDEAEDSANVVALKKAA